MQSSVASTADDSDNQLERGLNLRSFLQKGLLMKQKITEWTLILFIPVLIATMVIGLSLANADEAQALPAGKDCSLPCVSEVNHHGKRYIATIEVAGKPHVVKAWCGKKQVKVDRLGKHTWMMPFSKGKTYTIKAKAKHGKWKMIQYRLCKC